MRFKQILSFTCATALLFALVGCQSTPSSSSSLSEQTSSQTMQSSSEDITSKPLENNKVVVYAPEGNDARGEVIKKLVYDNTGIEVEFFSVEGAGTLLDRILAEKSNVQADVIFGMSLVPNYMIKDAGIFQPYRPAWADKIPDNYNDKDDNFHSMNQDYITIMYNGEATTAADVPKDWLDFDQPQYKGRYIVFPLASETTRSYLSHILWQFYDPATGEVSQEGWDYAKNFVDNAAAVPSDPQKLFEPYATGAAPILGFYVSGAIQYSQQANFNFQYVDATSGNPAVLTGVGITQNAQNLEGAKRFVDYVGSDEFLVEYAKQTFRLPISQSALDKLPNELKGLDFKPSNMDYEVVAKLQNQWMEEILMITA